LPVPVLSCALPAQAGRGVRADDGEDEEEEEEKKKKKAGRLADRQGEEVGRLCRFGWNPDGSIACMKGAPCLRRGRSGRTVEAAGGTQEAEAACGTGLGRYGGRWRQ